MKLALRHLFWSALIGCVATSFHPKWAFVAIPLGILSELLDMYKIKRAWNGSIVMYDLIGSILGITAYLTLELYGVIGTISTTVALYLPNL